MQRPRPRRPPGRNPESAARADRSAARRGPGALPLVAFAALLVPCLSAPKPAPAPVHAIYVTGWTFGGPRLDSLIRLADTTEVNAFVVDVKDDTGYLTYLSKVPTAIAAGANGKPRTTDAARRLALLHKHHIRAIARIVIAKDPLLAAARPAWAIQDDKGAAWRDSGGSTWLDAYNDSVWTYAADLAAEAVKLGFDELQFDYLRFPDAVEPGIANAVFPARHGEETTRDGILRNLRLLRGRVKPLGVPFTIDVFGFTASAETPMPIGQVWEDLVSTADVVLPMVYPSHYRHAFHGIDDPNAVPYRVVHLALEDGMTRAARIAAPAEIRPYLQAFTQGAPPYTPEMVREQIRATEELGIKSWALWNAESVYPPAIFRRKRRH